jgi:hypothetical protein
MGAGILPVPFLWGTYRFLFQARTVCRGTGRMATTLLCDASKISFHLPLMEPFPSRLCS